ncbi:MAG: LPS export ABC transporter permease LptG [Gammaproteobacteria bacterium]|nr:LPS export ABC transporter permease LptG [Gammaproteobacteria bacterium]MCF6230489.1 LPS export ABC transporter permease LptG [Gammaproteobacteria bacterium]
MRLLDRYIANAIIGGVAITLFVLLALFAFIGFIDELDAVGRGNYGLWQAIQYLFLSLIPVAYQLFPIAALVGCIMGLGGLASHGELIAMRAAGVSLNRLLWSVSKVGLLMVFVVLLLGEGVAPYAEASAQKLRSEAITGKISLQGEQGMWAKDEQEFIRVRDIIMADQLANLTIYQFSENNQLLSATTVARALYEEGQWQLQDVEVVSFTGGAAVSKRAQQTWQTSLDPEMIEVVQLDPDSQSMWGLYQYINYLQENAIASGRYEMAFWGKVVTPLVTLLMMLLAVPFVMGSLRAISISQRIFVGTLVGLGFHLFNQASNYVGLVFGFNAPLSALLPAIIVSIVAGLLIRRLR